MGVVYRAFDREREIEVALKLLRQVSPENIYRFKREFRALADVTHVNLVPLYELLSDGDQWFFTMALIDGVDFLRAVRGFHPAAEKTIRPQDLTYTTIAATPTQAARSWSESPHDLGLAVAPISTPAQVETLRDKLSQLVHGIRALHALGTLHRDIKPSNVLVGKDGRVVLLDFGIAIALGGQDGTPGHGTVVGTPSYMAPEQAAGVPLTEAGDWYAVGVMLYEVLAGMRPFVGTTAYMLAAKKRVDPIPVNELAPQVPADLASLCMDLLSRAPGARPVSAEILRRLGASGHASSALPKVDVDAELLFVGRDAERAVLREKLERVRRGEPQVVLLHGGSGMGKTSLANAFLSQAEKQGSLVLRGRCYQRESLPYKGIDEIVDELGRYLSSQPETNRRDLLPAHALELAHLFPALRRVVAGALPDAREEPLPDPMQRRRRALSALSELLHNLASRQPLVLFIDDAQWGDPDSAALLLDVVGMPEPPPLLLLINYQREDEETSAFLRNFLPKLPDATVLALQALSASSACELASALLTGDGDRTQVQSVAAESGGNPMFVLELVRHVKHNDPRPKGAALTLDEVVTKRIEALPGDAARLLQIVSLAGGPVPREIARRCARLEGDAPHALTHLQNARFVRLHGMRESDPISTSHDRVRELTVALLSASTKKSLHERLALEFEASETPDAEALVDHWLGADKPARAGTWAASAAQQAANAFAFDRAARLYRLALTLCDARTTHARRWQVDLASALAHAGRGKEAAQAFLDASETSEGADALEYRRRAAMQLLMSGHIDEGLSALRTALADVGLTLPETPQQALRSLLWLRARVRLRGLGFRQREAPSLDQLARADACWSAAIGLGVVDNIRGAVFQTRNLLFALRAGEPRRVARALATEAMFRGTGNRRARDNARRLLSVADDLASKVDDAHTIGLCQLSRGLLEHMGSNFRAARELCDQAEQTLRTHCKGTFWEISTAQFFAITSSFWLGDFREIKRRTAIALREAENRGDLYSLANLRTTAVPMASLAEDTPDEGRRHIVQGMAPWSSQGFHVQHLGALVGSVLIGQYEADYLAAHVSINRAWPDLRASMLLRVEIVRMYMNFFRGNTAVGAAFATGTARPHLSVVPKIARQLRRIATHCSIGLADLLVAGHAAFRGQRAETIAHLQSALRNLDAGDVGLYAAAARRRLGQFLGGREGTALVGQAEEWMQAQGIVNVERITATCLPFDDRWMSGTNN